LALGRSTSLPFTTWRKIKPRPRRTCSGRDVFSISGPERAAKSPPEGNRSAAPHRLAGRSPYGARFCFHLHCRNG
jgi:hypothetical protein